jgi:hypothetical protein
MCVIKETCAPGALHAGCAVAATQETAGLVPELPALSCRWFVSAALPCLAALGIYAWLLCMYAGGSASFRVLCSRGINKNLSTYSSLSANLNA